MGADGWSRADPACACVLVGLLRAGCAAGASGRTARRLSRRRQRRQRSAGRPRRARRASGRTATGLSCVAGWSSAGWAGECRGGWGRRTIVGTVHLMGGASYRSAAVLTTSSLSVVARLQLPADRPAPVAFCVYVQGACCCAPAQQDGLCDQPRQQERGRTPPRHPARGKERQAQGAAAAAAHDRHLPAVVRGPSLPWGTLLGAVLRSGTTQPSSCRRTAKPPACSS